MVLALTLSDGIVIAVIGALGTLFATVSAGIIGRRTQRVKDKVDTFTAQIEVAGKNVESMEAVMRRKDAELDRAYKRIDELETEVEQLRTPKGGRR